MRRYSSFLVQRWMAEAGQQRLSIRHIQSNAEQIVTHLAEAQEWMAARIVNPSNDTRSEVDVPQHAERLDTTFPE